MPGPEHTETARPYSSMQSAPGSSARFPTRPPPASPAQLTHRGIKSIAKPTHSVREVYAGQPSTPGRYAAFSARG
eukprot:2378821-Rhodomonas_salina.2